MIPLLATKLPDLAPPPADFERAEYLLPKDWHDFACEAPQLLSTAEHRLILRPIYARPRLTTTLITKGMHSGGKYRAFSKPSGHHLVGHRYRGVSGSALWRPAEPN